MPEFTITHDALSNLAHHLTQETRYFEQEGDEDKAREFEQFVEFGRARVEFGPGLGLALEVGHLAHQALGAAVVFPNRGIGCLFFQLRNLFLLAVEVKDAP